MSRVPRVVSDTNVVFEGGTGKGGAAGLVVDAWLANLLRVCARDALAYAYADVPARKLSTARSPEAVAIAAADRTGLRRGLG